MSKSHLMSPPVPRTFGAFNSLGLWTLYKKEVHRFMKVMFQTVVAPVGTTLLFMAVFSVAIGANRSAINGVSFTEFLAPGLILMGILNNSFANASSSLLVSKVQGNTVDFLMPPLSPLELSIAFIGGAITRGVVVGLVTALALMPFVNLMPTHLWAIAFHGLGAAAMLGMIGLISGIWAEKFDQLAVVNNFFIMPMTFLSGTFYSVNMLPEPVRTISHFNPFFYMIDGFRYGFTGVSDGSLLIGVAMVLTINIILALVCYSMLRAGWRLKS